MVIKPGVKKFYLVSWKGKRTRKSDALLVVVLIAFLD